MTKEYIKIDKGNGKKELITKREVKKSLKGYYKDVELALIDMRRGITLQTSFFLYKYKNPV